MRRNDAYLERLLAEHSVDTGHNSPVRRARGFCQALLAGWPASEQRCGELVISGSFAKSTAVRNVADIDLLVPYETDDPLWQSYESLFDFLADRKLQPRRQTVSIRIKAVVDNVEYRIDLIPARISRNDPDHQSLWVRRLSTWRRTDVNRHASEVIASGRQHEIRLMKVWRTQKGLEFPSFLLELATIKALKGVQSASLAEKISRVFVYLRDEFANDALPDPASPALNLSDDLTDKDKVAIARAAALAANARAWTDVII